MLGEAGIGAGGANGGLMVAVDVTQVARSKTDLIPVTLGVLLDEEDEVSRLFE